MPQRLDTPSQRQTPHMCVPRARSECYTLGKDLLSGAHLRLWVASFLGQSQNYRPLVLLNTCSSYCVCTHTYTLTLRPKDSSPVFLLLFVSKAQTNVHLSQENARCIILSDLGLLAWWAPTCESMQVLCVTQHGLAPLQIVLLACVIFRGCSVPPMCSCRVWQRESKRILPDNLEATTIGMTAESHKVKHVDIST